MVKLLRTVACIFFSLHLGGCFSFHEIPAAGIAPGTTVRVRITSEEALRLQQALGQLTTTVQGQAINRDPDTVVGLTVQRADGGPAGPGFNTFIAIPLTSIEHAEQRRLDIVRTALLAGAGAAAALAVVAISAGGTESGEPPDMNARLRVPLLSVRFR